MLRGKICISGVEFRLADTYCVHKRIRPLWSLALTDKDSPTVIDEIMKT